MNSQDTMSILMLVIYVAYFYAFVKLSKEGDVPSGLLIVPFFLMVIGQYIKDKALARYSNILLVLALAVQFKALYDLDKVTSVMILPYIIILLLVLFKVKLPLQ